MIGLQRFKWFTSPDHAPFRDDLPFHSLGGGIVNIDLSTKFEISTSAGYEKTKGDAKCRRV